MQAVVEYGDETPYPLIKRTKRIILGLLSDQLETVLTGILLMNGNGLPIGGPFAFRSRF